MQYSEQFSDAVNQHVLNDSKFHPNLGAVTKGGMANHFPMTVMSLAALGGSDIDIERFISHWPRYRTPINQIGLKDKGIVTLNNWQQHLGLPAYLIEFKRVFLDGLTLNSKKQFITDVLSDMADGLPMGLFHPVIRLAFANMHGNNELIADALAYFAIRYENLFNLEAEPAFSSSGLSALEHWQQISEQVERGDIHFNIFGPSLTVCEQLCGDSYLQRVALQGGFAITKDNFKQAIREICQASISLYLYEPALTTLHCVTAVQALADITSAYQDDTNIESYIKLWYRHWIWLTGLFVEKGTPTALSDRVKEPVEEDVTWPQIAKRATALNEVHAIKMLFSLKWLAENINDHSLYKQAALTILEEHNL